MNANDMDFQQKDLKTIISQDTTDKKEVRKKFLKVILLKKLWGLQNLGTRK